MKAFRVGISAFLCTVLALAAEAAVFEAANGDPARSVAVGIGGRVWQTNFNPNEPIKWHWQEGETSARVRAVDHVSGGERVSEIISHSANEPFGSFDPAVPADCATGREYLYDFTLEVFAGETLVRTEVARVAYLPGVGTAGEGSFRLTPKAKREWKRVPAVRLAAYDDGWSAETVGQLPATFSIGSEQFALTGSSGYFPISPDQLTAAPQTAALTFGTKVDYWTGLLYVPGGMMLLFR